MPTLRRLLAAVLLICGLSASPPVSPPAHAQADAAGADQLRQELERMFELYNAFGRPDYGQDIYFTDGIAVTPAGASYEVLLRNVRIFASEDEPFGLVLGDVSLVMAPLGDQLYRVEEIGPLSPFVFYGEDGAPQGQMVFEGPSLEGDFSTRYMTYLNLDARITGSEVTAYDEPGLFRTGPISLTIASREVSDGVFDQTSGMEVRDLSFVEGGRSLFRLNRFGAASAVTDMDLQAAVDMMRDVEAGNGSEPADPTDVIALFPGIGDTTVQLEGLLVDSDEGRLSIGSILLAGGYESQPDNMAAGSVEISFLDIDASGLKQQSGGMDPRLIPTRFTFKARVDQLPNKEVLAFLIDATALADEAASGVPDVEGSSLLMTELANSMGTAGSTFTIDELSFANQVSAMAGTGQFRANPDAALSVDGFFRTQVAGISNLQTLAQQMAASENAETRQTGQGLLGMLGLLMVYAQGPEAPEPTVEGALAFDVKVRPDGALTINGTPLLPPQPQQ